MIQTFENTAKRRPGDRYIVEQFGWVNLADAYANGVIPGDIDGQEISTNGIEDSGSILGRPSDVFEAFRMADMIEKRGASKGESRVGSSNQSQGPIASDE